MTDTQYIDFPCTVVNKTKEYIDVQYSRNNAQGELDTNYYAISRFSADQVDNFEKVTDKAKSVRIEHAALTEELLAYEKNKRSTDELTD